MGTYFLMLASWFIYVYVIYIMIFDASTNKSTAITYAISGGPDASFFSMSGDTLSFNGSANYEAPSDSNTDGVFEVYVQTSSGTTLSTQTVYVRVTDAPEAPVISTTSISSIAENSSVLATISASDADSGSSLSFTLVNSEGLKDEGLLSIDSSSGTITFVVAPNFESPSDIGSDNTIDFSVQVSDGSLSVTQSYSFSITNTNEAPVVPSASFSIAEQSTLLGVISATDPDSTDLDVPAILTYTLASGSSAVDDAKFTIQFNNGEVSFLSAPNFESPTDNGLDNVYNFTVNVSDGTNTTSQAMTVTVGDVNESPSFSIASAQSYTENSTSSISVAASDPDASSALTYSLSGSDASRFSISSSGSLSFASAPDYESPADTGGNNIYNVSVIVSDGAISSTISLVITVSDSTLDNFGIQLPANVAIAELQKESE